MKVQPVGQDLLPKVVGAMGKLRLFRGVEQRDLMPIAAQGQLAHFKAGELLSEQGKTADGLVVLLSGKARLRMKPPFMDAAIDVGRLGPMESFGLADTLLASPARFTVEAGATVLALRFGRDALFGLFERVPAFGPAVSRELAARAKEAEPQIPLMAFDAEKAPPSDETLALVPMQFASRHRVLPLSTRGQTLTLGVVDELTGTVISAVHNMAPGMDLQPVRITAAAFDKVMQSRGGALAESGAFAPEPVGGSPAGTLDAGGGPALDAAGGAGAGGGAPAGPSKRRGPRQTSSPRLDPLLKRMVAEGASDLHLSAGHKPRWRIDGELYEIADAKVLGTEVVFDLFKPIMADRSIDEFVETNDADFAYAVPGVARFRCNLFRDHLGVGAVLRTIPDKILTFEQLGLPEAVRKFCDQPKGIVLVTGPTGSGKSTTLAAMMDYINKNRRTHIITLEDPIEFVHKSRKALVNQREVGEHTQSFHRALKAALREDPDIVLVGEMRDIETVSLALETANTGHLVFGTLHTATAVSTVDRIIDLFPPEQQGQIRSVVADALKGVVSQTLLKKKGGGRIAALEVLVGSAAISNLIREGKNHQIPNIQMTAKKQGNRMLNEELEKLVKAGKVDYEQAIGKSLDKAEFAKRFGREYFEE
jgi:pilus retraction protein PilT